MQISTLFKHLNLKTFRCLSRLISFFLYSFFVLICFFYFLSQNKNPAEANFKATLRGKQPKKTELENAEILRYFFSLLFYYRLFLPRSNSQFSPKLFQKLFFFSVCWTRFVNCSLQRFALTTYFILQNHVWVFVFHLRPISTEMNRNGTRVHVAMLHLESRKRSSIVNNSGARGF